jgi:dysferlin
VIIWLLSNGKRSAYYRLPANEVFYSKNIDCCGYLCGKVQTITFKWPEKNNKNLFIPAEVRIKIWFGLAIHEQDWLSQQKGADLAIYAETYENQTNVLGQWTTSGPLMTRPAWSDVTGNVRLNEVCYFIQ